jgi:hypothetical protein
MRFSEMSTKQSVSVTTVIPLKHYVTLSKKAKEDCRSVSSLVRLAIMRYLEGFANSVKPEPAPAPAEEYDYKADQAKLRATLAAWYDPEELVSNVDEDDEEYWPGEDK